jgi:hypothetical protein
MERGQRRDDVQYDMRLEATYQLESLRGREGGHTIPQHPS